jgi:hypothetical protein
MLFLRVSMFKQFVSVCAVVHSTSLQVPKVCRCVGNNLVRFPWQHDAPLYAVTPARELTAVPFSFLAFLRSCSAFLIHHLLRQRWQGVGDTGPQQLCDSHCTGGARSDASLRFPHSTPSSAFITQSGSRPILVTSF